MAAVLTRDTELSGRKPIKDRLLEIFEDVDRAYTDSGHRINDQIDYWDAYDCKLGQDQFYAGNTKVYIPIIQNAVNARKTRFGNQIFPQSGRYVDVTTGESEIPHEHIALLEHYIEVSKLKDEVIPALLKAGDIEGQYNLYVTWSKNRRYVTERMMRPVKINGIENPADDAQIEQYESYWMDKNAPCVEVISDSDVVILPATANSIEEALDRGGSVTILRRWTKQDIRNLMDDGEFVQREGQAMLDAMSAPDDRKKAQDMAKKHVESCGIKGKGKYVIGFETWTQLKVGKDRRLCRAYYGGNQMLLGAKLCPYWSDLCPLLSAAVEKVNGTVKGKSKIGPHNYSLQLAANDIANQGFDSATFSMLPIIMTDPARNPRVGTMILDLAAVWEVDPNSTKFAEFPQLWSQALEIIAGVEKVIYQNLSVNPAMMPQSSGRPGAKRNQAEIANEQMVDVLTTADAVSSIESGILNPLLERFAWLDMQFRDTELVVKAFGNAGLKASMVNIPPIQQGTKYKYRWLGVEAARNAQQIQLQIAAMNIIIRIPPQLLKGREIDLVPVVERLVENTFGPKLAPLIFKSVMDQLSVDPEIENDMLMDGFDVPVHMMDDDPKHIQAHQEAMQGGDPTGKMRVHILLHQAQITQKNMARQMQQQQGGGQGRGPQGGAQPAAPRQNKGPPGMIPNDQFKTAMPRKM